MAGQIQRIDTMFDLSKITPEFQQYIKMVQDSQAALMDLYNTTKGFKDANVTNLTTSTEKLKVAMDGSLETIRQTTVEHEKLVKSYAQSKYINDQQIKDTIAAKQALKDRTDQILAEGSAYKKLTLEYDKQAKAYKDMAAALGLHNDKTVAAQKNLAALDKQIKDIDASTGRFNKNVGNYSGAIEKFGFSLKGLGPFFGSIKESFKGFATSAIEIGIAFIGVRSAFNFIEDSVKEFAKAQTEATLFKNILENVGRADLLDELTEKAKELSEHFKTISQRDVVSVFQKLITYGKLTKDQIEKLTPVIIDLAAKTGRTLPEATDLVTKSLEGNNRGLREFGINIKEAHNPLERLSIIMKDLKPRVDGAAEALGDTLQGKAKKAEIAIEELKVEIGEKFGPAISGIEEQVLKGVRGIPELFQGLNKGFETVTSTAYQTYLVFLKLASFGLNKGLDNYLREQKAQEALLESQKKLTEAQEYAEKFKQDAAKHTVEWQEKNLKDQKALLKSDLDRYNILKKNGELETENGKIASKNALQSIRVVQALEQQLKSSKDNSVIGAGGGDNAEKFKEVENFAEGFKKILDDIQAATEKAFGINLSPLQKELNLAYESFDKYYKSIQDLRDKDLEKVENKLKEKKYTPKQAAQQKVIIDEKANEDLLANQVFFQTNIAAITEKFRKEEEKKKQIQEAKDFQAGIENAKKLYEQIHTIAEGKLSDVADQAKTKLLLPGGDTAENRKAAIKAQYDYELQVEVDKHARGLTSESRYQYDLAKLRKGFNDANNEENKNDALKAIGEIEKYVGDAEKLIGGLTELRATTQLNALLAVEDQEKKNYQNQVNRINNSTDAEVTKAAKLSELNAKRQVEEDQNEQKKRQIEQQRARFQKAEAITSIILNTAKSIAAVLDDPFQIVVAAALGAAELAIASATPIPHYGEGVYGSKSHPGGFAVVGDKFEPELIKEPGQDPYWSASIPTLTDLAAGSKVIPMDVVESMRASSMMVNPFGRLIVARDNQISRELHDVKNAILWQTEEYKKMMKKNKPSIVNRINIDGTWRDYIKRKT